MFSSSGPDIPTIPKTDASADVVDATTFEDSAEDAAVDDATCIAVQPECGEQCGVFFVATDCGELMIECGSCGDGQGCSTNNICRADSDGDGVANVDDNCEDIENPDQLDGDEDGVGDVCDNCLENPDPDQTDSDEDGYGDVCDCPCAKGGCLSGVACIKENGDSATCNAVGGCGFL